MSTDMYAYNGFLPFYDPVNEGVIFIVGRTPAELINLIPVFFNC